MATISNIKYYLPEKVLTNEMLSIEFPDWEASKIEEKVGIRQRHIAADSETALDMAEKSALLVLEGFDKEKIDFLLFCTQSPDYYLPTGACILQERLGLSTNIGALDFNLGCSGYVYGLALAKGLITAGIAANILLLTSETYSKHLHTLDKGNRSIFGDGASASIITKSKTEKIMEFVLGSDGKGKDNLITPNGAFRKQYNHGENDRIENGIVRNDNCLYMNGPEIFNFTIETIPALIQKTIEKNKLTIEQIDYFVFHQANKFMLDYLRKKLNVPKEKFYINLLDTGNTVSSTIPIALSDCLNSNKITRNNKVLIAGFGVGYSWGATVIEIS